MKIIDTSGQQCPAPLIATKHALKDAQVGDLFQIVTDNQTSFSNISRFLKDNNTQFSFEESGGFWTLTITKASADPVKVNPVECCTTTIPHFTRGDFIIAFTSDKMGEGDDELGHLLMNNFIKAIKDLDMLPRTMVFYNKGVVLGTDDSPVVDHLNEIEKMGVGLLFCATCANHYSLREKINIGSLSNMYEIAQVMASASSIINP
jgi:selenium metabolism protein YedF